MNLIVTSADAEYFRAMKPRLSDAVTLNFLYETNIDDWAPAEKSCHGNVDLYARYRSQFEPVRGWLIEGGFLAIPHSVLRDTASGELIDITPPDTVETPPRQPWATRRFVCHHGSEQQFDELKIRHAGGFNYALLP